MLTRGLSVISVVVSVMYVHGLYFCCCIFFFAEQVQHFLHNLCLQGVTVIYIVVSVLYVHGLYLFCCIFCFLQNKSLFPCIYANKVVVRNIFYVIGKSFDKMQFTCNLVDLGWV